MSVYRGGWLIVAAALILTGMLAAAVMSLSSLVVLFTAFALVGAVVVLLVRQADGPRGQKGCIRDILLGGCVAGSLAGAFAGLTRIMGAAAIIVALVVVASSPWVVGASRRWLRTVPSPLDWPLDSVIWALSYSGPTYAPFQPPAVQPVSDDQLLRQAWCASYRALEATTSRRKAIRIIEERSEYLDELERRNPAALAAWLASAATAADNPSTYLSEARVEPSPIDWNELLDSQDDL